MFISLLLVVSFSIPYGGKAAIAVAISSLGSKAASNENSLTIYSTNDIHGHIEQCTNEQGGFSIANVAKLKAAQADKTLLVDSDDHSSGYTYANYDFGMHMIDFMRMVGYDMAAVANHEFDVAMEGFNQIISRATSQEGVVTSYSYVACNFYLLNKYGSKGGLVVPPYKIIEKMVLKLV